MNPQKHHMSNKSLTTLIRPKHDDWGSYSILKVLTHNQMQERLRRLMGHLGICGYHLVNCHSRKKKKPEQRSTYCGETGNSDLHMARVPIALEHLHSNQHARHCRLFLIHALQKHMENVEYWASQCRTLLNVHVQSIGFDYGKDMYSVSNCL